ncbi:MAG: phosphopantetheine adenylyltransferase [Gammaproteobacteria bacterium]|nr:MAG: phosphopantetheine adenylyltransferase [Gammaproteobacteria bacterium]
MLALYPGSFDPITNGHIDLVRRATRLFDRVLVAVAASAAKRPLFSLDERVALAREALAEFPGVTVEGFTSLVVEFARARGAEVIIRGLRAVSDFEYEVQMAAMNRSMAPDIETVYLSPDTAYTFLSSTLIKDIARHGGDVSAYVHPRVREALHARLAAEGGA